MKKQRSEAQKLATLKRSLREVWHRSPMYWEAYNRAKVAPGILRCEMNDCGVKKDSRLCEIDHIEPIVDPKLGDQGIQVWVYRLMCPANKLMVLCEECHAKKTLGENRLRKRTK